MQYSAFIEDFAAVRPTSAESFFRMQTLLVHAWRKFPFLDPDLPAELLPVRLAAPAGVRAVHGSPSRWQGAARSYFEELEAGRGAQAA